MQEFFKHLSSPVVIGGAIIVYMELFFKHRLAKSIERYKLKNNLEYQRKVRFEEGNFSLLKEGYSLCKDVRSEFTKIINSLEEYDIVNIVKYDIENSLLSKLIEDYKESVEKLRYLYVQNAPFMNEDFSIFLESLVRNFEKPTEAFWLLNKELCDSNELMSELISDSREEEIRLLQENVKVILKKIEKLRKGMSEIDKEIEVSMRKYSLEP